MRLIITSNVRTWRNCTQEAAQMNSVRTLLPRFEAKIQRVLDRMWGTKELE